MQERSGSVIKIEGLQVQALPEALHRDLEQTSYHLLSTGSTQEDLSDTTENR